MKTEHAQAEWEWELMREVSARPIFKSWQQKRSRAQGAFRCVPYAIGFPFVESGAKAFDMALGRLAWLAEKCGDAIPTKRGAWDALPNAGKAYYANCAIDRRSDVFEVCAPFQLIAAKMTGAFAVGDWGEQKPSPIETVAALLRDSQAGPNARVLIAVVDEGVNVKEAKELFGKALTQSRKGEKQPAKQREHYKRLLRGLRFFRIAEAMKRGRKCVSYGGALSREAQMATGLGARGWDVFRDLKAAARKEIKQVEQALSSVKRLSAGLRKSY